MKGSLYIKSVKGKGRGVFSTGPISKDDIIEECPVIVLPQADYAIVSSTRMVDYCFFFNREKEELAIVLGFGSIYNHAVLSNACHQLDRENKTMVFYATTDIKTGEEICINYTGDSGDDSLQWFTDRNIKYRP
jgi:SET domain-containing protein